MSVLSKLMVDTKSAWIDFPGFSGFKVEVATLARPELIALRKRCMTTKFKRGEGAEQVLDDEKFISLFTKATVKNWKGLRYKYLERLMPVEITGIDPEEEVPFSSEDAELLVANSSDFDTWLNDVVFDLDNFRTQSEGRTMEASGEVAA